MNLTKTQKRKAIYIACEQIETGRGTYSCNELQWAIPESRYDNHFSEDYRLFLGSPRSLDRRYPKYGSDLEFRNLRVMLLLMFLESDGEL